MSSEEFDLLLLQRERTESRHLEGSDLVIWQGDDALIIYLELLVLSLYDTSDILLQYSC